ncbi:MAG: hypothetical protein PVH61_02045 [Candidatus Aminicenantes bacterium]
MNDFSLPGMVSSTPGTIFPGDKRFFPGRNDFSGFWLVISRSLTLFTESNDFFPGESLYLLLEFNFFIRLSTIKNKTSNSPPSYPDVPNPS